MKITELVDKLERCQDLSDGEFLDLLTCEDDGCGAELARRAMEVRVRVFGRAVYLRGLIEITSFCRNDCYYCGLRRSNTQAERYRLTQSEILSCAETGYALGFRTFVLQGGEDPWFTDDRVCGILRALKARFPDCAVTLSIGERERESYVAFYRAGADRYLLRHETADAEHYRHLHPDDLSLSHRLQCLRDLRDIGYQVGCGMMVGSPYQTPECLLRDLRLLQDLRPHMVGLGPFLPHQDTPFRDCPPGPLDLTLRLLSIVRLLLPEVLLPATTALGTLHPQGRERGLLAGANVLMPNLSPAAVRGKYLLYDNKIHTGIEAAENMDALSRHLESIGFCPVQGRGDAPGWMRGQNEEIDA